jgi:FAD/FMN-containing dehydrogenase
VASGAASPSPDPSTLPAQAWRQLSRAMIGPLLRPGHEHFETLHSPATNRYPAPHPQAIARYATPDDVAHAINFARRLGLETAVRGAGHSFADHSSTTGLLIETGLMNTVAVDGDLATIGAGTRLAEIYRTLHQHRAAIPAGCGPTVGIAGLALGGGLGVLGRTYGLTCDRLTAVQIVLADGAVITCDLTSDPDLYWALRGAGAGNFGVATALSFRTVAEPQAVAFQLSWPDALATLPTWMEWMPEAPAAMAASLVVRASADSSAPPRAHLIGACPTSLQRLPLSSVSSGSLARLFAIESFRLHRSAMSRRSLQSLGLRSALAPQRRWITAPQSSIVNPFRHRASWRCTRH